MREILKTSLTVMVDLQHQEQLQFSIAKALLYSDIFSYPLTAEEVFRRLTTNHTSIEQVTGTLNEMSAHGIVYRFGNFYAVRNDEALQQRRLAGNQKASQVMPAALRRGML